MGKKSRFSTMFCKKLAVFCGIFLMTLCMGVGDANAKYCNSYSYKVGAGKYCDNLVETSCPAGCYCTGGGNISWVKGDVKKGCENRWSKMSDLAGDGVNLCPTGYTSNAGAKSQADCFKKDTASSADTATSGKPCSNNNHAPAGSYCGALLTKTCKPGCYCTGGGNFTWAAGDVEKGCREGWSKVTSELNPKGVFLCPQGCTSVAGAGSESDCFLNGHSDIKCKQISCPAGQYLPTNSATCVACPADEKKSCPGATNVYPSSTKEQGIQSCLANQVSNTDRTACIAREQEYIECNEGEYAVVASDKSKCNKCKGDKFVCPGGKWQKTIGEHGLEECTGYSVPNATKTACEKITVTCQAGEYLPANSTTCTTCEGAAEAAGKLCKGGTIIPSTTSAAGLDNCTGDMVPNKNHTQCGAPPPKSAKCDAGYYLPKNSEECATCPEKHTCSGGTYVFNETMDQGAVPFTEYVVTRDMLAYGVVGKDGPLKDQCWHIPAPDKYTECVLKAVQKLIEEGKTDDSTEESSDTDGE